MRYLLILSCLFLLLGCSTPKQNAPAEVYIPPTALEGPAYDPQDSPEPMTAATPLPVPAGTEPAATATAPPVTTYGQTAAAPPTAYQQTPLAQPETPPVYPASPDREARGTAAPTTYAAPAPAPTASAEMPPATVAAPTTYAMVQTVLTGRWVNTADTKEIVAFTPSHYQTYYEGQLLVEEDMTYHAECPGDCSGGASLGLPCFTVRGPAQTDCYGIVRLTDQVLELSLLGVSTETIVYHKLQ